MTEVRKNLDGLKEAIQNSEPFMRYQKARAEVRQYPEKHARLQEFRKKNYLLQNSKEQIDLFVELDRLEQEYMDLYKDPLISEYLASEVAVCRIVQQASREIIECLDFEAVLFDD